MESSREQARFRLNTLSKVSAFVFLIAGTNPTWAQGTARPTGALNGWNVLRFGMTPDEVLAAPGLKLRPADVGYGPIGTASEPALFMTDVSIDTIEYSVLLWFKNVDATGGKDYRLNDIALATETADHSGQLSPCPLDRVVRSLTAKYGPPAKSDKNGTTWQFLSHRDIIVESQSFEQNSCSVAIHYFAPDIRSKLSPALPAQY